jgi:hypothetical protein
MSPRSFEAPPFVAWLVKDDPGRAQKGGPGHAQEVDLHHAQKNDPGYAQYDLVPHTVFRNLLCQCVWQWAALSFVVQDAVYYDSASPLLGWLIYVLALPAFVCIAIYFNVQILARLNSQSAPKIKVLLSRCPKDLRRKYVEWLPAIEKPERAWQRHYKITWSLLVYFLSPKNEKADTWQRPFKTAWRFLLNLLLFLPKADTNAAKLEALTLRKEDSCLHAFSAFAAVTSFVSDRQNSPAIPNIQIRFLLSYFSPIGFGYLLCLITFLLYPVLSYFSKSEYSLPRFPFMVCIVVWLCQGSLYLLSALRQDFAAIFHNYFDSRIFPQSMTRYADEQMAIVPDLIAAMENHWIPWAIGTVMFGLAELYASFMHSLA